MLKLSFLLVTTFCSFKCVTQDIAPQLECSGISNSSHRLSVSINSRKNDNGEWVTLFSATKNSSSSSRNMHLDATQRVVECQGNQIIHIQGVVKDTSFQDVNQSIFFHKKCSSNAAITNNGYTLQKLSMDSYGAALTNRPLMEDELFEVRLEKKISKFGHAVGIGITTHSPINLDIPDHMFHVKTGTWMLYHTHVYQNGTIIRKDYLKMNLKDLPVGDRVGVMKSKFNTLHFYINGVDQGPAASNIQSPVYGVFELYGDAAQGTIVNPAKMAS